MKKSFIAYSDWKNTFDELPDEDAGKLIKHIFSYVNNDNPISDSILIKAVFANIKTTLDRDLEKWEIQLQQRIGAGKASAEQRATKSNERSTSVEIRPRNPTDNVSVSVNVSVNDNKIIFDSFREKYLGTKRGNKTEFENFCKKHKDWKDVLPKLLPALEKQIKFKEYKLSKNEFTPEWKNLSTWINQRCWEDEVIAISTKKTEAPDYASFRNID